jgi:hypothetical protein
MNLRNLNQLTENNDLEQFDDFDEIDRIAMYFKYQDFFKNCRLSSNKIYDELKDFLGEQPRLLLSLHRIPELHQYLQVHIKIWTILKEFEQSDALLWSINLMQERYAILQKYHLEMILLQLDLNGLKTQGQCRENPLYRPNANLISSRYNLFQPLQTTDVRGALAQRPSTLGPRLS